MTSRIIKTAAVLTIVALLSLFSWADTQAKPPHGESPPAGGEGALVTSALTERALTGFEQALRDGDRIDRFFAAGVVLTFGETDQQVHGREAVVAAINDLCQGVFTGQLTVTARIISGGQAATSGELSGTHVGVYRQLPPTGNSMRVPYAAFYEVENGLITSLRLDFSSTEIMRQLAEPPSSEEVHPNPSGRPF